MTEIDLPDTHAYAAYAELAKIIIGAQPLGAVLARVATLAGELIPGAAEVSVTLVEQGRAMTVAFSGTLATSLDERQYASGRGPCVDAAITGEIITVLDTATDELYPEFSRQADRAGIRTTYSIGLPTIVQGTTGALNIYGATERLSPAARDTAMTFASYAAVAVTNAAMFAGVLDEAQQMRAALQSRAVIDQAKGIIMAGSRCDADEAFSILRRASNREDLKLRDVAQTLVDRTSRADGPILR